MKTTRFRRLVFLAINLLCLQLFNASATKFIVDLNAPHEAGIVIVKVKKHLSQHCETAQH
jgi:hypothetical protein